MPSVQQKNSVYGHELVILRGLVLLRGAKCNTPLQTKISQSKITEDSYRDSYNPFPEPLSKIIKD